MNEAIENEIYEIEEMIALLMSRAKQDESNKQLIAELNIQLMRLKQRLSQREELHNDARPLSMGGEVSS
jgi:hypothetical protein